VSDTAFAPHFLTELPIQENRLLKDLTTFGIGGPARFYVEVRSVEQMQILVKQCLSNQVDYFVLGRGSNTLFDDKGFNGLVIHNKIDFKNELYAGIFHVGAGYNFSLLGSQTAREGWSGLEFASGIPGSVGGAVFMNAGANGRETCDSLLSVDFITEEGNLLTFPVNELRFCYRTSPFQHLKGAIAAATFALTPSKEARQKQMEIITYRKNTQPYGEKSAGCIFRNHSCGTAGALIDKSGLKGLELGGAKVSDMHANFIVNTGGAMASDVLKLIEKVKAEVHEKTGAELESEVRFIPYKEGPL
jgi:UDP-N-acetylmuramate dehydrogenase